MMHIDKVPNSIALIPDGNRRWAKKNSFSLFAGYGQGIKKFIDFSNWCVEYGVKNVVVWGFSTENFNRPKAETKALFKLYTHAAADKKILAMLEKNKTRCRIIGDKSKLPKELKALLNTMEKRTAMYKDRVMTILLGYGGREDLMHAAKRYAKSVLNAGKLIKIDEKSFAHYLRSFAVPDIDFVIRTSNEERVSGLLPWQISYSELYFSNKLWPDFTKKDLEKALKAYSERHRRFGK